LGIKTQFILNGISRSLLRGFQVLAKSVPEGTKFRNTLSVCGGDRNFEDFASLFEAISERGVNGPGGGLKPAGRDRDDAGGDQATPGDGARL
jgi:hypothetical protein